MAVEYTDETHVDPNKHYTTAEIAKMIREKKYGKDVRESIALFVESFDEVNGKLGSALTKVEQLQNKLIETQSKLETTKKELEDSLKTKVTTQFVNEVKSELENRIDRIILGTDPKSIEIVLRKIDRGGI